MEKYPEHDFWRSYTTALFPDKYDLGISFMGLKKVPQSELDKPWFNFHPGPLPEYRGRNLCYHAIMNGEREFGATLHYMDENFDTGPIIAVRKFEIAPWMTAQDVHDMTMMASESLFVEYLPRILAGEEFETYQNTGGTYYFKKPIDDLVQLPETEKRRVRAITFGDYTPRVNISGSTYRIVREE